MPEPVQLRERRIITTTRIRSRVAGEFLHAASLEAAVCESPTKPDVWSGDITDCSSIAFAFRPRGGNSVTATYRCETDVLSDGSRDLNSLFKVVKGIAENRGLHFDVTWRHAYAARVEVRTPRINYARTPATYKRQAETIGFIDRIMNAYLTRSAK